MPVEQDVGAPAATYWSMIAWALLAKSPNWASQITSAVPAAPRENPYSKPRTAASLRPAPAHHAQAAYKAARHVMPFKVACLQVPHVPGHLMTPT